MRSFANPYISTSVIPEPALWYVNRSMFGFKAVTFKGLQQIWCRYLDGGEVLWAQEGEGVRIYGALVIPRRLYIQSDQSS